MTRRPSIETRVENNMLGFGCGLAAFVGIVVFLLMLIFGSMAQVDAGHVGILTTFGKVEPNVLGPGFNFKTPFVQSVYDYDVRVQIDRSKPAAASRDLQDVSAEIALNFHPKPGEVFALHNEIGPEYKGRIIEPAIAEAFKATTAQYTVTELITQREAVKIKARDLISERLLKYHIVVDDLNITNFDFSADFNKAIEAANTARQQVITAQQTLEKQKVEAQLQVAQAEAAASATKTRADAEAYAITANAKAQAEAYRIQVASFGSPENYIEFTRASKWNGSVPTTVLGDGGNFLFGINR